MKSKLRTEEKHPFWKGNNVGINALHRWVERRMGKAKHKECAYCGSENNLDWANVSRNYKRNLEDWIPLCGKCHAEYDRILEKSWITRKQMYGENGRRIQI